MSMSSYQYRKSHCRDKTIVRSSYLHNGIFYTGNIAFSILWLTINRCSMEMDKWLHPTFYWACDYLSMLGLTFNHVNIGHHVSILLSWDMYYFGTCLYNPNHNSSKENFQKIFIGELTDPLWNWSPRMWTVTSPKRYAAFISKVKLWSCETRLPVTLPSNVRPISLTTFTLQIILDGNVFYYKSVSGFPNAAKGMHIHRLHRCRIKCKLLQWSLNRNWIEAKRVHVHGIRIYISNPLVKRVASNLCLNFKTLPGVAV